MDDGARFEVFRHVTVVGEEQPSDEAPAVLLVRFRFARLSDRANRFASLVPIPLIAGFAGFRHKLWMADAATGCWQGIYQWDSLDAAKDYQRSLVFGVMNRRAKPGSLEIRLLADTTVDGFLRQRVVV